MRVRSLSRRLGSAALVVTLGLTVAACGSDDSDAGSDGSSSDAAQSDDDSDGSGDSGDTAAAVELDAAGFYPEVMGALKDAGSYKFSATSSSSGSSSVMTGEARYSGTGIDMKATSDGAQPMELIMLDQVVYMKSAQMGLGDKWLKIDLKSAGDSIFGMLAKTTDPEAMFKAMESPKKLELVGEEEVDGVSTSHYRITIDPDSYMDALGLPPEMAQFMPEELVTDMWVDEDNLPRKYSQDIDTPESGGQAALKSRTEGFYTDFGADVQIEAPADKDVTEEMPGMPGAA